MTYIHSIVLGIIQGITEFLPISSSAHLVLIPWIFGWSYQGLFFDVALHFGTLLAVVIFFWQDWISIITRAIKPQVSNLKSQTYNSKLKTSNSHCEEFRSLNSSGQAPQSNLNRLPRPSEASGLAMTDNNETPQQNSGQAIKQSGKDPKKLQANKLTSYTLISYPPNLLWILLLATIPGAIAGALLEKQAETIFRNPLLIAIILAVFGMILWLVDTRFWTKPEDCHSRGDGNLLKVDPRVKPASPAGRPEDDNPKKLKSYSLKSYPNQTIKSIGYGKAFLIGLAQMLAIVPGVSRSGSTMAAGRLIGLDRPSSARFSFLLAAPIMLGAALFELRHFSASIINLSFIIALLASLISGLLAIKFLLRYLVKGNFLIFAIYRIALAVIVIVLYLMR